MENANRVVRDSRRRGRPLDLAARLPKLAPGGRLAGGGHLDIVGGRASSRSQISDASSGGSSGSSSAGARAYGPWLFWRENIPETELEPIEPGSELPGGLTALYDGRGRNETQLWLPEQRALVFADALTAPEGELRVWASPSHEERALPALRKLLELPFERVIVAHGEPVHDRAAYERALELPPWDG